MSHLPRNIQHHLLLIIVRQHHMIILPTINYQDTKMINIKITQPTITVVIFFRLRTTTQIQVLYTSIIRPFLLKLVTFITYVKRSFKISRHLYHQNYYSTIYNSPIVHLPSTIIDHS